MEERKRRVSGPFGDQESRYGIERLQEPHEVRPCLACGGFSSAVKKCDCLR